MTAAPPPKALDRRRALCAWAPATHGWRWRTSCGVRSREYDPRALGWSHCPFCGVRLEVEHT